LPQIVEEALVLPDEAIGASVVSQTLSSARHETQYSRLFRS
jgi:urease accessory protein